MEEELLYSVIAFLRRFLEDEQYDIQFETEVARELLEGLEEVAEESF